MGIEMALGIPVDIAINHDPQAIRMHKVNHPDTLHLTEDIFKVDLQRCVKGRHVALMWASPDCTSHSKAKGGQPRKSGLRILPWAVYKHAKAILPDVIIMENVEEIQQWGPLDENGHPIKERLGEDYKKFISAMKGLGYIFDSRELVAADYGAPTIRKRLFIIFRNDGKSIIFPNPTHGNPESEEVKSGKLLPWHTAAECINWDLECPSIFERKKPLAENTLRRIAKGIQKFVIENPNPFIIQVNHGGDNFRGQEVDKPMPTITAKHGFGVVAPTLIQYHGEQSKNEVRGQILEKPLQTVDTANRYGLVTAFMSKYFGGNYQGCGSSVDEPLHTITAVDHNALAAVHITQFNNHCIGQKVDEPLKTITCGEGHFGEVRAFLIKYYSGESGQKMNEPLHTIRTKDCFGLVTIKGVDYAIVDIGLRMLTPRELYNAQGFPTDYEIETDCYGNKYPKTKQVARCGNSVPPPFATALARANAPEWCTKKFDTMKDFISEVAI